MTTNYLIIAVATILTGFLIYCFMVDASSISGGTDSFYVVMCRVLAKNIKLVLKLAIGFILAYAAIMAIFAANAESAKGTPGAGGVESEKLARFGNRVTAPAQWMLDGFIGLLGLLAFAAVFFFQWFKDVYLQHVMIFNIGLFVLYLIWLWFTVRDIVQDEYSDKDKSETMRLSVAALGTWALIVILVGGGIYRMYTFWDQI
jgi:hypothetical protein